MNKNNKTGLVPKLRFPEFESTVEWKKSKIGEVFYNRQESGFVSLPLMSLTDEHGIIPQTNSNKKDTSNSDKTKYLRICIGDIVYNTMRMWQGRCAYSNVEGIVSPAYTVCTPQSGNNSLFFYYYFKTFNMIKKFHANSQGLVNDTLSLKYDAFSRIPIAHPIGDEQQKIADCLSSLEDLITAEDKKLEALRAHKRGLMQKLFPAEGKTLPEWRFPEFSDSDEWEETSLIELADFRRGSFPQPYGLPKWYDEKNGMPFIQVFDVDENLRLKSSTRSKISKLATKQSIFIPTGTVIVTIQGSIGRVAITQYDAYIDRTLLLFEKFYKEIEKTFIAYTLQLLFEVERKKAPGEIIKTITKEVLSSFMVKIPKIEEQQKIADCLSSVDDLIAAQSDKIEDLKLHKIGLMQGLFPSIEEVGE